MPKQLKDHPLGLICTTAIITAMVDQGRLSKALGDALTTLLQLLLSN